jgi:toxin ParE1/3/4
MHRLFEPTRTLRAEKGDHQQCSWSLSRWVHHESPRARRQQRAAAPHRAHARAKARVHRRRGHHRETRARQSPDRRYRLRLGCHSKSAPKSGHQGSHPCEPDTEEQAPARSQALCVQVSRRDVLPQLEALPCHCNAFREDRQELPLAPSAREREAVARRVVAGAGGRNLGQPLAELSLATVAIAEAPQTWPLVSKRRQIRRFLLARFPFAVLFLVVPDGVVVLAVAHTKRRPFYWRRRLP